MLQIDEILDSVKPELYRPELYPSERYLSNGPRIRLY